LPPTKFSNTLYSGPYAGGEAPWYKSQYLRVDGRGVHRLNRCEDRALRVHFLRHVLFLWCFRK
jgi:hypothetical protein